MYTVHSYLAYTASRGPLEGGIYGVLLLFFLLVFCLGELRLVEESGTAFCKSCNNLLPSLASCTHSCNVISRKLLRCCADIQQLAVVLVNLFYRAPFIGPVPAMLPDKLLQLCMMECAFDCRQVTLAER